MGPSWVLGAESTRLTNTRMVILSSLQARMKHPFYRLLTFPRGCHLSFKVLASLMLPHSCLAIGKASKPPFVPRLSSPPVSSPRAVTSSRGRLLSPPHPPALTPLGTVFASTSEGAVSLCQVPLPAQVGEGVP